jgi:hypothetical protein
MVSTVDRTRVGDVMRTRLGVVVVAVLVTAGCSGSGTTPFVPGGALSTTPAPASTSAHRPKGEAPAVPEPMDAGDLVDEPCGALTTEQLSGIGVTEPGATEYDDSDPGCRWHVATSTLHVVSLTAVASEKDGLSHVYSNKEYQQYFEPTEIDGYPAVYASMLDQRSSGNCELWVGVTDELAVDIATHFLETDPCPVAERIAAGMIEHARDGT